MNLQVGFRIKGLGFRALVLEPQPKTLDSKPVTQSLIEAEDILGRSLEHFDPFQY